MAWVVLAGLACAAAVVVTAIASEDGLAPAAAPLTRALDWQAALGLAQPWRLWTCAWVHWSGMHLLVNMLGAAVVGFTGWRARLPASAAFAWFLAWPGTQLAMAAIDGRQLAAAMPHYGGLSGVLHAGAIVLGLSLAWPLARAGAGEPSRVTEGPWAMTGLEEAGAPASTLEQPRHVVSWRPWSREHWIGLAIVAGTLAKVLSEKPWNLAPRASATLGIEVAPIAHACGAVAGAVAWALVRTGLAALARGTVSGRAP